MRISQTLVWTPTSFSIVFFSSLFVSLSYLILFEVFKHSFGRRMGNSKWLVDRDVNSEHVMGLTLYEANSLWATVNWTQFLTRRTSWGRTHYGVKPLDSTSTTVWFTGAETSLWSNGGERTKLTVGLPRCNMNWKVDFKRKQCCDGKKPHWNALPTGITRDISKLVCEVRRTDKCSFISIFALILKPLVQIPLIVSAKYFCRRNLRIPRDIYMDQNLFPHRLI